MQFDKDEIVYYFNPNYKAGHKKFCKVVSRIEENGYEPYDIKFLEHSVQKVTRLLGKYIHPVNKDSTFRIVKPTSIESVKDKVFKFAYIGCYDRLVLKNVPDSGIPGSFFEVQSWNDVEMILPEEEKKEDEKFQFGDLVYFHTTVSAENDTSYVNRLYRIERKYFQGKKIPCWYVNCVITGFEFRFMEKNLHKVTDKTRFKVDPSKRVFQFDKIEEDTIRLRVMEMGTESFLVPLNKVQVVVDENTEDINKESKMTETEPVYGYYYNPSYPRGHKKYVKILSDDERHVAAVQFMDTGVMDKLTSDYIHKLTKDTEFVVEKGTFAGNRLKFDTIKNRSIFLRGSHGKFWFDFDSVRPIIDPDSEPDIDPDAPKIEHFKVKCIKQATLEFMVGCEVAYSADKECFEGMTGKVIKVIDENTVRIAWNGSRRLKSDLPATHVAITKDAPVRAPKSDYKGVGGFNGFGTVTNDYLK